MAPDGTRTGVSGRVYFEHGGVAAGVRLRAYRRGFGGAAAQLGEETTTAADGRYRIPYDTDGVPPNVELRAVRTDGKLDRELPLTDTVFAFAGRAELNVVAPISVRPLAAEHRRLLADVDPHLHGVRLGQARETDDQPDLTLLQETTGWDSRLVALAASADRVALATGVPAAAAYAMLRGGLPDDPVGLSGVTVSAVDRALREAVAAGVVTVTPDERSAALEAFAAFARTTRLAAVAPGALSSQGDMLAAAGLTAAAAETFDEIYQANERDGGDPAALWSAVQAAGLPADELRRTGKLGLLTLNNAALTADLRRDLGGDLRPGLVSGQLYRPGAWVRRLTDAAGGDETALAALLPPAYGTGAVAARLRRYADDLARKVRVSYPTSVVADLVGTQGLPLPGADPAVRADVAAFLDRAAGLGLVLGRTPVSRMVSEHGDRLLAGVPAGRVAAVTETAKTLQRIFQITPTDTAMTVLLDKGFRSAHDVTAMSPAAFLRRHGADFATPAEATAVYAKAQQVSAVTLTVLAGARQLDSAPSVFALAGPDAARQDARTALIGQFPTMEQLFGSGDYCACDQCRSVLSPAAYFVDLLHFLDPPADQWDAELAQWRTEHDAPYPFADAEAWRDFRDRWAVEHPAEPLPATGLTPYQVLTHRRPDLARLPLSCENASTAMPYLDLVTETLEYSVVHGRVRAGAVRDTGAALTADLLVEPQFLLTEAYDILRGARYPAPVPFDLWLETVRRLLRHFDTPLWMVLDAFRRTDELEPAGPQPYGQAAVAVERLGLAGVDQRLLADPDPLPRWPELYGYPATAEAQALAELADATTLSRRLGVTYQELFDLLATGFVNPVLARIAALPKLGIGMADVLRYQGAPGHAPFSAAERADFEALLGPVGGIAALAGLWDAADLGRILVLADPLAADGLESTTLRYADGSAADPVAFLTLIHLVRLWRRLGWTLAETDRALVTFLPLDPDPYDGATLGPALGSALLGLARLHALRETVVGSRTELAELWSDLTPARYAELFLVAGTPAVDPVFEHPLGRYLEHLDGARFRPFAWDPTRPESAEDGNVGLAAHVGTVQAALRLTADDVVAILVDAGTTLEAAALNLPTVSVLHRYAVLARGLRIAVADLIALRRLSGLDPFAPPPPGPVTTLAEDRALTTVLFAAAVDAVRAGGLAVAEVDYLLRHRYDPAGPYLTAAAAPLALVRTLDTAIGRIRTEHADPVDASALTDTELRQKMALVLPADAVERFFGMLTATITYDAVVVDVPATEQLDPAAVAAEPAVTLTYDPVRFEQHLVYRGVLVRSEQRRLVAAHPGPAAARDRYAQLLDSVRLTAREFFDLNLLAPVGFLGAADYDPFFAPLPTGEAALQERLTLRRERLIAAFLPFLRDRLIDQAVLATVGAEFPDSAVLVGSLVTEPALLADRLWPAESLLSAYRAAADRGVTATADAAAGTAGVEAYLEVPTAGAYRFFLACDLAGTTVDLRFDHLVDPVLLGTTGADGEEPSASAELVPGTVYHLVAAAAATGGGAVTLLVQGENLPKGPVDRLTSHPADSVERVRRAHVLLDKAVRLAAAVEASEPELRHLLTHPGDFGGLSLGGLPVDATEDDPAQATVLFGQLRRLLDHAALRREMGAAPGELTELFAQARRTYPAELGPAGAGADLLADLYARVAVLTRRDPVTVADAADRLHLSARTRPRGGLIEAVVPELVDEVGLRRLWTVLALAGRLGVTPGILRTAATPAPDAVVARRLRDAVRARYDVATWRRVAQPIFDELRQRRRDALVAWIMHRDGFDRVEQLFEFFLVDPGTEPVVQTSRLRLAISAVQLFVQRCLLSLEPDVHPAAIESDHWLWMKRYRVWEANRKIFLWPHDWLDPEFRDDKTHLFQALEGSLFSADVTDDLAEQAFAGYLRDLEGLARLDVRATYVEEQTDPTANTVHVVARTFGAPHRYFYRSRTYGMWTPWLPVGVEIDGNHVVVAVWRQRVHLLWVTFVERAEPDEPETRTPTQLADVPAGDLRRPRVVDAHLHWTERYDGEWTEPAAGPPAEPVTTVVDSGWRPSDGLLHVSHDGDALLVHVSGGIDQAFRLESKNSPPVVDSVLPPPAAPYQPQRQSRGAPMRPLSVEYVDRITKVVGITPTEHTTVATVLASSRPFTMRTPANPLTLPDPDVAALVAPAFFQAGRHTFYVEPALTEVTIEAWDGWVIPSVTSHPELDHDGYWDGLDLLGQVPAGERVPPDLIATEARFLIQPQPDWVTDPGSTIVYDGETVPGPAATGTAATAGRRGRDRRATHAADGGSS